MATKTTGKTKSANKANAVSTPPAKQEKIKHNKTALGVIAAIIILFAVVYLFKGWLVAASVNGEEIKRYDVVRALEKQGGKETLDSMITKTLIAQEAKNKNITVSQADIDSELNKISKNLETQGTTLDQALAAQGMTKNQLISDIKIQLYLQKMLADKATVTEKEITDFITANKSQFPEETTDKAMREQSITQLKQQKTQTETQKLIKELQDKSKTIYFVQY